MARLGNTLSLSGGEPASNPNPDYDYEAWKYLVSQGVNKDQLEDKDGQVLQVLAQLVEKYGANARNIINQDGPILKGGVQKDRDLKRLKDKVENKIQEIQNSKKYKMPDANSQPAWYQPAQGQGQQGQQAQQAGFALPTGWGKYAAMGGMLVAGILVVNSLKPSSSEENEPRENVEANLPDEYEIQEVGQ